MSTQGNKLTAIADAIREKEGSTGTIPANDFPDRIRSISPGVKSFNGRMGDVVPADGDYTAEQVGALPISGGTMTGVLGVQPGLKTELNEGLKFSADNPSEIINSGVIFKAYHGYNSEVIIQIKPALTTMASSDFAGQARIRGVADPQTAHDAANKTYVDSVAGGFSVASNAGAHNSLFRGEYLGSAVTSAQYAAIAAGTFDDLFIGDYWTINGVNWRIAAFDYYLRTGGNVVNTHHAVIVPDEVLDTQKMNDSSTTTGGYVGSKMYTTNIAAARTKVKTAFSGHVLIHEFRMSNTVESGKVTASTVVQQDVVLMSERNVYGQRIMSSECNDGSKGPGWYTYDRTQFPLFLLAPEFIQKERTGYWLRDVVSASSFAIVDSDGAAFWNGANYSYRVRPAFSIHG